MKKVIVILGITALSLTLFLNAKSMEDTDSNLSSILLIDNASAEGVATVPCTDVEETGGSFRARWCTDCTWQDVKVGSSGTCTFEY